MEFAQIAEQAQRNFTAQQTAKVEADKITLDEFFRRERVPALIDAARKEIAGFPKWYRENIEPVVKATPRLDQHLNAWLEQLEAPMHGKNLEGVFVPPLVDQLHDGLMYVNRLSAADIEHGNGYRIAQIEINKRLKCGDMRGYLLRIVGQIRGHLKQISQNQ